MLLFPLIFVASSIVIILFFSDIFSKFINERLLFWGFFYGNKPINEEDLSSLNQRLSENYNQNKIIDMRNNITDTLPKSAWWRFVEKFDKPLAVFLGISISASIIFLFLSNPNYIGVKKVYEVFILFAGFGAFLLIIAAILKLFNIFSKMSLISLVFATSGILFLYVSVYGLTTNLSMNINAIYGSVFNIYNIFMMLIVFIINISLINLIGNFVIFFLVFFIFLIQFLYVLDLGVQTFITGFLQYFIIAFLHYVLFECFFHKSNKVKPIVVLTTLSFAAIFWSIIFKLFNSLMLIPALFLFDSIFLIVAIIVGVLIYSVLNSKKPLTNIGYQNILFLNKLGFFSSFLIFVSLILFVGLDFSALLIFCLLSLVFVVLAIWKPDNYGSAPTAMIFYSIFIFINLPNISTIGLWNFNFVLLALFAIYVITGYLLTWLNKNPYIWSTVARNSVILLYSVTYIKLSYAQQYIPTDYFWLSISGVISIVMLVSIVFAKWRFANDPKLMRKVIFDFSYVLFLAVFIGIYSEFNS